MYFGAGFQETEAVSDVVVSRHGQGQEEDVVLELVRRSQEVARRCAKVHTGDGPLRGIRGGRRREASSHRQELNAYSGRVRSPTTQSDH